MTRNRPDTVAPDGRVGIVVGLGEGDDPLAGEDRRGQVGVALLGRQTCAEHRGQERARRGVAAELGEQQRLLDQ